MGNINRDMLGNLRADFANAVKGLESKYNIKIELGNGSYNDSSATFKMNVTGSGENGEVIDKSANDFMRYCEMFGLEKSDFGKTFSNMNGTYEICGIKPSSYKYPILAKKNDKIFKFPVDVVKAYLKK